MEVTWDGTHLHDMSFDESNFVKNLRKPIVQVVEIKTVRENVVLVRCLTVGLDGHIYLQGSGLKHVVLIYLMNRWTIFQQQ